MLRPTGRLAELETACTQVHCMKTIHKSVLLWHSAHEMFALVTDVQRYPQFLPWCEHGEVLEQQDHTMVAKVGMAISGLRHSFTTRNVHETDRKVSMALVDGPFSHLDGCWVFTPLGDGSQRACKVEFTLSYGFSSATLAKLVGPVFDKIAGNLVDAFVKRADQIYGSV
jgi:ribosome-associated toxin RatA of RatAB toxin-antitoxin module